MDKSSRQKWIFFNNLLLLGFDKAPIEKETRVSCDQNMFSLPNQKMFEIVTHFLFSKLKGKYDLLWPLLDKDQHRQFQKLTYNYLLSISQKSNIKFPRITPSLLSTFSGDRFYELYAAFSSYVVEQEILTDGDAKLILQPKFSPLNCKDVAETLKIGTILAIENSQRIQKLSCLHFEELLIYANDFSLLIKKLKSSMMVNHSKLQERITYFCSLYSENPESLETMEDCIKKSVKYEKKVEMLWTSLETFLLKEQELWKYLCSEVEENSEKCILDGADIKVTVPDILTQEHAEELNTINAISEGNGKPFLLRYMKLFIISLESYLKSYKTGKVSNIYSHCEVEETESLDKSLNEIKLLSEKIVTNILANVKESTENLHQKLLVKEFSDDLEDFIKECQSWSLSSKSFHERIKSTRSNAFLPFSNENPKSSLLLSESSGEAESISEKLCEECFEACYTDDLSAKCNPSASMNSEPTELLNENPKTLGKSSSLTEETVLETAHKENVDAMNDFLNKNMLSDIQNMYLQNTNVGTPIPPLLNTSFNLDFDYSKPFKMRESWQLEESLQAITIPDDSIIE